MDFKTFLVKKVLMSFLVSITCISVAMAFIGMTFEPDARFGYEAFLSPLIFAALASLPMLVKYSKRELSVKQAALRNVMHFVLLELIILSSLHFFGLLSGAPMALALGVSIFIIDLAVNLLLWIGDKRTATDFNSALVVLQNEHTSVQ